jgi:hypothetical protein
MPPRVILLHRDAQPKPPTGAACNGCGVCCASAPCPLGMWLSRRRRGACAALQWSDAERRYLCGAIAQPRRWLPWLPATLGRWLARRWIAAARGCDCDLQPAPAQHAHATGD